MVAESPWWLRVLVAERLVAERLVAECPGIVACAGGAYICDSGGRKGRLLCMK